MTDSFAQSVLSDRAVHRSLKETYNAHAANQRVYGGLAFVVGLLMLAGYSVGVDTTSHPERLRTDCITEQADAQVVKSVGYGAKQITISIDDVKIADCVENRIEGVQDGQRIWGGVLGAAGLGMTAVAMYAAAQKRRLRKQHPEFKPA